MKQVKLYEVREFVGNEYSRPLGRRLRARGVAARLVRRLKKQGRAVFAAPVRVTV